MIAVCAEQAALQVSIGPRVAALHREVLQARPALCSERAALVTRFHRRLRDRREPRVVQRARALAYVLRHKQVRLHPGELLVGCFTSKRVGGGLLPELHGVVMLEDLWRAETRAVNPFRVSPADRRRLLREVLPVWAPRFLALRAQPPLRTLRFLVDQLWPTRALINETGGVSHFVPDYAGLLARGTRGFRQAARERLTRAPAGSPAAALARAVIEVCDGLDAFAWGYRQEALYQAAQAEGERRRELLAIAEVCARVPEHPARSLHEGLQSLLFAQIALNLESLDNSVSPGRLDQLLGPLYQRDREAGRLDAQQAFELLGCYAVKLCELVPFFSRRVTRFHGGLFSGQVVVVGGTDAQGRDATNELTHLLVELMDQLRTRQPNYHARLHPGSPAPLRARIARALARGAASPAVYNDQAIVPLLRARGVSLAHARDYATVGCVEPVAAGRSFFSTDAALLNLPLCLELALNDGRRFGRRRRCGAATGPAEGCRSIDELFARVRAQLEHAVARLLRDLRAVEAANARLHPTPLTSMLLIGCLEAGRDATAGGAAYNGSGIQGVGAVEVGDALAALDWVVFRQGRATLAEVIAACRADFAGREGLRARLRAAPKYGNDDPDADGFVSRVLEAFAAALAGEVNTRGGAYVAGYYSVTAHQAFGEVVGALPSGRGAGAPFSSGLSPASGRARLGPTAALCSQARLPLHLAPNGVNFNLQLDPWVVAGPDGARRLQGLIDGAFAAGCMQAQVNVLDLDLLRAARDHPGRHPGLLVRVSGYSAYFDDLSPAMQQELIDRLAGEER